MSKIEYTRFEEQLKSALDNYEVEYDATDWAEMEQRLDAQAPAGKSWMSKTAKYIAAAIVAAIITVFLVNKLNTDNHQVVENNTIEQSPDQNTTDLNIIPNNNDDKVLSADDNPQALSNDGDENAAITNEEINESEDPVIEIKDGTTQEDNKEVNKETTTVNTNKKEGQDHNEESATEMTIAPNTDFTISTSKTCVNAVVSFFVDQPESGASYSWNFGDESVSDKTNTKHTYKTAGNYPVVLTTRIGNKEYTSVRKVIVKKAPEVDFNYTDISPGNLFDPSIQLTSEAPTAVKWQWKFDNKIVTEENTTCLFKKKGTYPVKLTVTDGNRCQASKTKAVPARGGNLMAPTAFSPNGDGNNDTWIPFALKFDNGSLVQSFEILILGRTGTCVDKINNITDEWDGRIEGNGIAKLGQVFGWVAVVKMKDGKDKQYTGSIIIVNN